MKLTRFEIVVAVATAASLFWPYADSLYIQATAKPKAAFYQELILWSFPANYSFIFAGLLLFILCASISYRSYKASRASLMWLQVILIFGFLLAAYLVAGSGLRLWENVKFLQNIQQSNS